VIRLTGKPDPKIWNAYKKKFGRLPTQNDLQELLFHALVIFQMMITKYVLKSVFEWPQIKTDKEYLSNLNGLLFREITDLYTKLRHLMTVNNIQGLEELMDKALKQFYPQNFLDYFANPFEDFGLFEDLKKVGSTGLINYESEDVELDDGLKKSMASGLKITK
jgi:hypothetical protein